MYIKVMKWVSITALLLAITFWDSAASYQLELNLVVCAAAAVVLIQALQAHQRRWAVGFVAIALLFNPVSPMFRLAGAFSLALVVFSIVPFAMSLVALRPSPMMSIPSITDRNPGSRSL